LNRVWKPLILKTSITPPPIDEPTTSTSRVALAISMRTVFGCTSPRSSEKVMSTSICSAMRMASGCADRRRSTRWPADQREVRPMPAIRGGKRRMQEEADANGIVVEDLRATRPSLRSPRCASSRPDHDGTHDVEDADLAVVPDCHGESLSEGIL
jgi:hypothetical protein